MIPNLTPVGSLSSHETMSLNSPPPAIAPAYLLLGGMTLPEIPHSMLDSSTLLNLIPSLSVVGIGIRSQLPRLAIPVSEVIGNVQAGVFRIGRCSSNGALGPSPGTTRRTFKYRSRGPPNPPPPKKKGKEPRKSFAARGFTEASEPKLSNVAKGS